MRRPALVALLAVLLTATPRTAHPADPADVYYPGGEMGEIRNEPDTHRFFDWQALMDWIRWRTCQVVHCKRGGIT